jgi:hypothetical protein
MTGPNRNATRKIARALASGWTPAEFFGPSRWLKFRPRRTGRRANKRQAGGRNGK